MRHVSQSSATLFATYGYPLRVCLLRYIENQSVRQRNRKILYCARVAHEYKSSKDIFAPESFRHSKSDYSRFTRIIFTKIILILRREFRANLTCIPCNINALQSSTTRLQVLIGHRAATHSNIRSLTRIPSENIGCERARERAERR